MENLLIKIEKQAIHRQDETFDTKPSTLTLVIDHAKCLTSKWQTVAVTYRSANITECIQGRPKGLTITWNFAKNNQY